MSKNNKSLNLEQKKAVEIINGPLLVLAGAGTGKTRVITYRIANLINNWVKPEHILALTFTNKAAREMKDRVKTLVEKDISKKLTITTFHSFCLRVLKSETKSLSSLHRGFTIADEVDQKAILKQVLAELNYTESLDAGVFQSAINRAKNELIDIVEYKKNADGHFKTTIEKVYERYQEKLSLQNMVDFDDLLLEVFKLWEKYPNILEKYQDLFKFVLIDEFQDTNHAQFEIVKLLVKKTNNICVVGDDDQSIYGWRGAKVENILDFQKFYPEAKTIKLEQNYRSTNNILKAANSFVLGNTKRHGKNLWSENDEGEKLKLFFAESDVDEAIFVANEIIKLIYKDASLSYKDVAVLYRSNHQSRLFEQEFRRQHIPYKLVGSHSFFERKEVRDAVAYLKLLANTKDDQSLLRIINEPPRGVGAKCISNLRQLQEKEKSPLFALLNKTEFLSKTTKQTADNIVEFANCVSKWKKDFDEPGNLTLKVKNYFLEIGFLNGFQRIYKKIEEAENRRENVVEFINSIAQFENDSINTATLNDFLHAFSLLDDNDDVEGEDKNPNSLTMMTVHAAKGLEFSHIFLVGMEQNIFPHIRALEERDESEERRLFYVAITRAKNRLILSNAKTRYCYGSKVYQQPSEFLREIPEELVECPNAIPVEDGTISNAFSQFYQNFH